MGESLKAAAMVWLVFGSVLRSLACRYSGGICISYPLINERSNSHREDKEIRMNG